MHYNIALMNIYSSTVEGAAQTNSHSGLKNNRIQAKKVQHSDF